MSLKGEKVYLKILSVSDISQQYVYWMNDAEVMQYIDGRWKSYTLEDLIDYVSSMNKSQNNILFGIFDLETNKHIGNIKVGSISTVNRRGSIGLIIGDKNFWGKGIATEAIRLVSEYAFKKMNLRKLTAGMYAINNSYKAFLKNEYVEAGRLREHVFVNGKYVDVIKVERIERS